MKILYAADNNGHAKIQLERFLQKVDKNKFNIKISAYRNYFPNCKVDWTLDCLLLANLEYKISFVNNRYLDIYLEQVRKYNPDLIISDCEFYTSFVATQLNIKLWNVSNKLFNYAIHGIYKKYAQLYKNYLYLYRDSVLDGRLKTLIQAADKNYIYSHWGDAKESPSIIDGMEWVRPYFSTGEVSVPCQHKYVAADIDNSKNIIDFIKDKQDCVLFTNDILFSIKDVMHKSFKDQKEYGCNLYNCNYFICNGNASHLADAVYNNKNLIIIPDPNSKENLFNYLIYYKIYNYLLNDDVINPVEMETNPNIKFLHQHLESL